MKFADAPKFLIQGFFDSFTPVSPNESYFVSGVTTVGQPGYFDLIVMYDEYQVALPFNSYASPFPDDNFLYVKRMRNLETEATSGLAINDGSAVYLSKSSLYGQTRLDQDSGLSVTPAMFDQYVKSLAASDTSTSTTSYLDYTNIQKPFIYIGQIYPNGGDYYRIDYWGMARYALSCLPPHLQTTNIQEFFKIYFDKVFSKVYNKEKSVITLLDAAETDLSFIQYLANFYGVTLNKSYVDSLYTLVDTPSTKIAERRVREYVGEMPNLLKRKGTYASLYIIFKNFFWNSADRISVYERWHNSDICNGWPDDPNAVPNSPKNYFVDVNYLEYYNAVQTLCVSAGYLQLTGIGGYPIPLADCFIYEQPTDKNVWYVFHNLAVENPVIQCYDINLNYITPANIRSLSEYVSLITFTEAQKGVAFVAHPDISESGSPTVFQHNLDVPVPISDSYSEVNYTNIKMLSISPSGYNTLLMENILGQDETIVSAIRGDFIYEQDWPASTWELNHNLDSKAILTDFYTTESHPTWNIVIESNTDPLMIQPYTSDGIRIYPTSVEVVNNELVDITFGTSQKGFAFIDTPDETYALPASSSWNITMATSGHYITEYISSNELDYTYLDITMESPIGNSTISTVPAVASDGYLFALIPDYEQIFIAKSDTWVINHEIGTKNLLTQFYTLYANNVWTFGNAPYSNDVIVRCYDSDRNLIHPDSIQFEADRYVMTFSAPVSGFITMAAAAYATTEGPSGLWVMTPPITAHLEGDIITQYRSSNNANIISIEYDVQDGMFTAFMSTNEASGYGFAVKGNYIHQQTEAKQTWWVEHNLNTYNIVASVYSPYASTWPNWVYHLKEGNIIVQCYDINNNWIDPLVQEVQNEGNYLNIVFDYLGSSPTVGGYACIAEGSTSTFGVSGMSWTLNHGLANRYVITQCYNSDGFEISPSAIVLTNTNTATITFDEPVSGGYVNYIVSDYVFTQAVTADVWFINHNLNKDSAIIQCFDSSFKSISPSGIFLDDNNNCTIVFGEAQAGHAIIKGIDLPLYEMVPASCQLYNENWLKLEFQSAISGMTVIRIADELIIMPTQKSYPTVSMGTSGSFTATWDKPVMGYAMARKAVSIVKQLFKTSPLNFAIDGLNSCNATFTNEDDGLAVVKEIGRYGGTNLIMSPHYKVEIDVNCEPLCSPDIIEANTLEQLIDSWESDRPACKYAHYNIFVAPKTDWSLDKTELYNEQFNDTKLYTYCCIDTMTPSAGYVHSQYIALDTWDVYHNLGSTNILVQCFDYDRNMINPIDIKIETENKIEIVFESPQQGIALIAVAKENFTNTDEASASWGMEFSLGQKPVLTDFYFYNNLTKIVPSNVQIAAVDIATALWYVPTLGYCYIRDYEYIHIQSPNSKTWFINHMLGYDGVIVQCFDSNYNLITPNNINLDKYNKTCTVTFTDDAYSGYAIVTAVGNTFTVNSLISSFAAGGYIKIGGGTNPDLYDPKVGHDLKDTNAFRSTSALRISEDTDYYYILGKIEYQPAKSVTEIGLFTAENEIVFYSYVKPTSQLYKSGNCDMSVLFRIVKPPALGEELPTGWGAETFGDEMTWGT